MSEQGSGLAAPAGWSQKDVTAYDMLGVSPKRERTPSDPSPGTVRAVIDELDGALADLSQRLGMLATFLEPVLAAEADAAIHKMGEPTPIPVAPLAGSLMAKLSRVQVLSRDVDSLIDRLRIQ